MLVQVDHNQTQAHRLLQTLKAYNLDKMVHTNSEVSFLSFFSVRDAHVFFTIFKLFRRACVFSINSQGLNMRKNIVNQILSNPDVRKWANALPQCLAHRKND